MTQGNYYTPLFYPTAEGIKNSKTNLILKEILIMEQYLALPLNTCIINVGYKQYAPGYNLNGTKATHYGVDFIGSTFASNRGFFASGNGVF